MNGSSDGDNVGKDNVVVAVDGDSRTIGISGARSAMSRMKFRRD
ncbi:hypothetical protein [uncultured Campylobacter sp.]|nr:hypothetical protein [uncultured Campylobacter sp.]